jgi:hypothetical protein
MIIRKTYKINNYDTPSANGAVVTYLDKTFLSNSEANFSKEFNLKRLIAGVLLILFTLVSSFQLSYIHSALAEDLPLTAPLTSPEIPQQPEPPKDNPGNGGGGGGNSNSNSGGGGGAPLCNDTKPGSIPRLIQAQVIGNSQVNLTWTKALDPVTHYLLSFGVKPNTPLYGDPNLGGKNTTSYIVKGLQPGATYFFKVSAVNGCTPGDASNELSIRVRKGATVNAPVFAQIGVFTPKQGSIKNSSNTLKQTKPKSSQINNQNNDQSSSTGKPSNNTNGQSPSSNNKPAINIFSGIGNMFGKFMNFMSDPAYN